MAETAGIKEIELEGHIYTQLSMCKALEMDEIREVFCMCHELRF